MGEGYNKLVRNKIPEHLDAKGISYEQRTATPAEYRVELIKKLDEEVKEFLEEPNSEELADILEVIETLRKLPEFSNVEEVKKKKLAEKGGFDKKIILKGEK
ncbi:MAG: nucleoside triphosphate pyrophosphohydrolase [Candidatus Paceibacterota bacterium]